jgi:hypothetical protein
MRKLIAGACILALAATASPALADGQGHGGGNSQRGHFAGEFKHVVALARFRFLFGDNDWRFSRGNHFGWFRGKHWGWFKPHNPHWPHEPPMSP